MSRASGSQDPELLASLRIYVSEMLAALDTLTTEEIAEERARVLDGYQYNIPLTSGIGLVLDTARSFEFLATGCPRDLSSAFRHAKTIADQLERNPSLDDALARARQHTRDLIVTLDQESHTGQGLGKGQVASLANRLLAVAAWVLPDADRARYAEEYRSELWEIAHARRQPLAQLRYALRQVASSLRLRVELLAPRRRGAAP